MIRGAFLHLPGIGPGRIEKLHAAGIQDWDALRRHPDAWPLGARLREQALARIEREEEALRRGDIHQLITSLHRHDHWRVLSHFFDEASFFDIESAGYMGTEYVTVICCYHHHRVHTFIRGENLDDFLDLLDDIRLLVSFNGASFDVPMIKAAFHIPEIPCPHVDLRWICYHENLRGGLKQIERNLGLRRPADLEGVGGEEAIWLWNYWAEDGDRAAREKLLRYCAADAASLKWVGARVLERKRCTVTCPSAETLWKTLSTRD